MEYGGIETTLINLLNKINYEKYDVDLVLLKKDGELFKNIPNNVNIVSSIDSKIINKIILSNNIICKIIKHLLFNYFTALLWTTNKKYDVAISFSGYYAFIDRYISSTSAKKKLIWVHTDVKRIYDTDAKYKRIFDKRKNKYKRFDNIICVSKSVEKSFTELLPEHKKFDTLLQMSQEFPDLWEKLIPEPLDKETYRKVKRLKRQYCFFKWAALLLLLVIVWGWFYLMP